MFIISGYYNLYSFSSAQTHDLKEEGLIMTSIDSLMKLSIDSFHIS